MNIIRKIRGKGILWFLLRLKNEIVSPSRPWTHTVIQNANSIVRKVPSRKGAAQKVRIGEEPLVAIYDLNHNPVTFDFAYFLIGAELFARQKGINNFVVWIVKDKNEFSTMDSEYMQSVDPVSVLWRMQHVLLALIDLCPSCIGHNVLPHGSGLSELKKESLVYPEFYSEIYKPGINYKDIYKLMSEGSYSGLSAPEQGLKYVEAWRKACTKSKPIVTITIRQYGYDESRNSDIDAWVRFAEIIKDSGYAPIFVPDTDSCFDTAASLEGQLVFRDCCWNLGLRLALYEIAFTNFFISSGPAALAQLSRDVRYICMKQVVGESSQAKSSLWESRGITVGQRILPFARKFQINTWSDDTLENILQEFDSFVNLEHEDGFEE